MTTSHSHLLRLFLFSFLVFVFLSGCHPRPVEDLALADVALRAAQKVKADGFAPDLFRKAENYFLRAKKDYADGYFESCRKFANDSRMFSEQAEFKSLQKQTQLKDKPGEEAGAAPESGSSP